MRHLVSKLGWLVAITAVFAITMSVGTASAEKSVEKEHKKTLQKAGWKEVWSDEFDDNQIDLGNWSHEVNCQGGGNNEQQCYTDRLENSFVADGKLHIVAKEESYSGQAHVDDDPNYNPNDTSITLPFTSARLRTKGKVDFRYGRAEIRAKVVDGQGMWPAIWMLPTDYVYGGWPSSGEIDIFESFNPSPVNTEVAGTLHYGLKWPQWTLTGASFELGESPAQDFHVYAIEWEADEIRWYVDGEHYQTQRSDGWYNYIWQGQQIGFAVANPRAPFDENFHMILNMAVGGDPVGAPDTNWSEDRVMMVDYVRLYECKHNDKGSKGSKGSKGCAIVDESVQLNTDAGAPGVNDYLLFAGGVETLDLGTVSNTVVPGHWDNDTGLVSQSISNVWDINFGGAGNVFLTSEDMSDVAGFDAGVNLSGGAGWTTNGEIEFDMLVVSAAPDSQFTVKLDSGWPSLGEKIIDTPPVGEWQHVAVSVADLLANPNSNGGGVNLSDVLNLFVLDYSGSGASVQLDNIRLQCAVNSHPEPWQLDQLCSMDPKVATVAPNGDVLDIYVDAVTDWNVFDCCGGSSIAEVDLGGGNNALQFTYDSDPGTNTVTFFQTPAPVDLSAFAGGTIEFDMFVVSQPTNPASPNPWLIKVDCDSGCSTGDRPITDSVEGVLPATGVWQHYTFDIDTLVGQGLNLSTTSALVIFPAWGNQDNAVYQLDNIKVSTGSGNSSDATLPVDFESANVTYNFAGFEGGEALVVGNPDMSGANLSANVGQMIKYPGAVYAGSTLALAGDIDFSSSSVFTMNVWASRPVPVLFKLEGLNQELTANHSGSGTWEELTFDFTGVTGAGATAITLIYDLGVAGDAINNPADWTFYFDDISLGNGGGSCATGTGTGATGATEGALSLRAGSGLTFTDFGGGFTAVEFDPTDAGNTVASTTKSSTAELWSGVTFNDGLISYPMTVAESQISVRVYSADAGIPVRLKLEDASNPTLTVETEAVTTVCDSWETLTFDFNNVAPGSNPFNPATTFNKSSIFFNFGTTGAAAGEQTYLWDAIEFVGATGGGGGGGASEPTGAAPIPTASAIDVISLFSDAYTNITGIDYNPFWGQATVVTQEAVAGNNTLKYAGLNYQGTDFAGNPQDVSAMTSLHLDFWTADSTALNIYLISTNAAETAFALPGTTGSWVSVDIPLSAFAGVDLSSIMQLKFDGNGTIYLDNVYFTSGSGTGGGGGTGTGAELTTNGDFATGDKSGWTEFTDAPNGGSFTVDNATGSFAGNLVAAFNESPVIKQANIGIGTVTPNTSVTIEFDLLGSLIGDGGVVFAEFFSELTGGGVSSAEILSGGPLTPTSTWTHYSYTTSTGSDISGGVTLQLKAACGMVVGCGVDASFDNVTVTIN